MRPSRETRTATRPLPCVTCCARRPSAASRARATSPRSPVPSTTSWASSGAPGKACSIAACARVTGTSGSEWVDGSPGLHPDHRERQRAEGDERQRERPARAPGDGAGQGRPGPAATVAAGAEPGEPGDPALVDAVAEPGQRRGQHGQRADHGDQRDEHRRRAHRDEHADAGHQQPGQRDEHRHAGDEDGAADGGRGRVERRLGRAPGATLLALAADVEQRVVDADGQADEHDQRRGGVVHRQRVRQQRQAAERGHHRGQAEQQRHRGRHERPEGEDEDDQRDRDREDLRALEVVSGDLAGGLVEGRVAGLLEAHAAVRDGGRVRGVDQRLHVVGGVVGIAAHRDLDQRGAPARLGQLRCIGRAVDGRDLGQPGEAPLQVARRGGRLTGRGRAHEHGFVGLAAQPGVVHATVGLLGLADAGFDVGHAAGAGHRAGGEEADDEDQPEGDHGLRTAGRAVCGAAHEPGETVARGAG